MKALPNPTAQSFRLWVQELERGFEVLILRSDLVCASPDGWYCAFVSQGDVADDIGWLYRNELLCPPTQVSGIAKDERFVPSKVKITIEPKRITLPDYKTPWPPFLPYDIGVQQWRILPNYDKSRAYLEKDAAVAKAMDYAGAIGAHDLYLKVLAFALISQGADPLALLAMAEINSLQRTMVEAIAHDHT